jgi:selenide,water dikinase
VVAEAGGTVAGGHTIRNPEPIYGLAVQGIVDPDVALRKSGARAGDVAVLSKPIGTGLSLAAGSDSDRAAAIAGMRAINRSAAERLMGAREEVGGATDVTGYGLAGHGWEMADRSGLRLVIDTGGLRAYPGALEAADRGVRTGGDPRNREYVTDSLDSTADAGPEALCFDPQTSGGLLAAVTSEFADALVAEGWWRVGTFEDGAPGVVLR